MKKGETWVSKLEGRSHMGLRIVEVRESLVTLEVDRSKLDKSTGEVRLTLSTVVIPKDQWRFWELSYELKK